MRLLLLFLLIINIPFLLFAQKQDSIINPQKDSVQVKPIISKYDAAVQVILANSKFLNTDSTPAPVAEKLKRYISSNDTFYLLAALALLLALIKFFYIKYFNNLFKVFFNTSLRQNQLTDQLLQSKLPSLFFNTLFILSGGAYLCVILKHYEIAATYHRGLVLLVGIAGLAIIYSVKFCTLKFMGWVTDSMHIADTYSFIVFLICKILGILLIPFTIIIAFVSVPIANACAVISLVIIGLFLVVRFFRAYSLLQNQLNVSFFHFVIYIIGIEILPLLVIYKALFILLTKNL